jgi:hypothetical protein
MVSAARSRKLDQERLALEESYLGALTLALRDCVDGRWGLFGQNDDKLPAHLRDRYLPESARRLEQIGIELTSLREELGFQDSFPAMRRLAELRSQRGATCWASRGWQSFCSMN